MHLRHLSFRPIPRFAIGAGEKGCTPFFEIYQLRREKVLLYSSENTEDDILPFEIHQRECVFDVNCMIQGDILIQFKHITPMHSQEPMFHFVFNVGMVHSETVIFPKGEIEKAEKDARFPNNFQVQLKMEPCTEPQYHLNSSQKEIQLNLFMKRRQNEKDTGEICFYNHSVTRTMSRISLARDIGDPTSGSYSVKGGWMYKRGHKVKNWKRRWFVLRANGLFYYKNPRSLKCAGEILLHQVESVRKIEDTEMPFCFEIIVNRIPYIASAATPQICSDWFNAIQYAVHLRKIQFTGLKPLGGLSIRIIELKKIQFNGELCCTISLGNSQKQTARALNQDLKNQENIIFQQEFELSIMDPILPLKLSVWENDYEVGKTTIFGTIQFPLSLLQNTILGDDWYKLSLTQDGKHLHDIQIHLGIEYTPISLYNETIHAEEEMLYPTEQRSSRLLMNEIANNDNSSSPHNSFSKYLSWGNLRRSGSKNSPIQSGNKSQQVSKLEIPKQTTPNRFESTPPIPRNKNIKSFEEKEEQNSFKMAQKSTNRKLTNSLIGVRERQYSTEDELLKSQAELEDLTTISVGIIRHFKADFLTITAACYANGMLWTGDLNGSLHLWNITTGEKLQTIKAHKSRVNDIVISEETSELWSCASNSILICDLVSKKKF